MLAATSTANGNQTSPLGCVREKLLLFSVWALEFGVLGLRDGLWGLSLGLGKFCNLSLVLLPTELHN